MKVKLSDIFNANQSLVKIANAATNIKSAYWISKLLKKIDVEMNAIEKARVKMVEKYGVKNDKDGFNVPQEKVADFQKEFSEFLETEVEINIPILKVNLLGETITPGDIIRLEKFFDFESLDKEVN